MAELKPDYDSDDISRKRVKIWNELLWGSMCILSLVSSYNLLVIQLIRALCPPLFHQSNYIVSIYYKLSNERNKPISSRIAQHEPAHGKINCHRDVPCQEVL